MHGALARFLTFALLGLPSLLCGKESQPADSTGEIIMTSWPCVSPDGRKVAFEWRDDIWSCSIDGGRATRITAHPARDSYPRFSPDGKTLYFCSTRSGTLQLYSMPVEGGPATQHSFHSEGGTLETISPDGNTALIRGERDEPGFRPQRLIQVDLRRNAPETYLFNTKGNSASWLADGSAVIFCREGEQLYRKGYRGPRASSIWRYDFSTADFTPLVKEEWEARSPLPWPDGNGFYYVSEQDGTFNLWSRKMDGSEDHQLTHFKDDGVMLPALSGDGSTLVFRRGFDLWKFFPQSGDEPVKLNLWQAEDLPDTTKEMREIDGTVDADFSSSGLEIVFRAEGELWTMDTVLREPNRITRTDAREDDAVFSQDSQYIYYAKDDGLECQIWRMKRRHPDEFWWQTESFENEQLTFTPAPKSRFSLSPDGQKLAYVEGSGDLMIADADGKNPQILFECWNAPTFDWSPDGEWIVFAAQDQNFNRDIYIVPSDGSRKPFNVSRHPDFEGSPRWSPDGTRIAFTGRRLNNEMGLFYVNLRLDEAVRSTRDLREIEAEAAMRDDPTYQDDSESEEEPPPSGELQDDPTPIPSPPKKKKRKRIPIDFDGLSERVVRLNTRGIEPKRVMWSGDSESILFQSENSSNDTLYQIEPRPGAKMESIADERGLPIRSEKDGTLYWIVDQSPAVLKKGRLKKYSIDARLLRDRIAHQRLCFRLVWRTLRDRFYDPEMNGLDWNRMLAKYETVAAEAPDSRTFDRVVGMLLGELNASHLTFISEEWPKAWQVDGSEFQQTRHLGIRFQRHGAGDPLTVASVIAGSPAASCQPPVKPGDTIVRINGMRVDSSMPVYRFMNGRMDRRIELVVRDAEQKEHSHSLEPISYEKATLLAEAEVITQNRDEVDQLSDGKLGYIHIARMFWDDFDQFEREIYAAGHGKSGLIIDIRDNGGGFTTDHLLTVLCQPRHAVTIPRDGGPGYPQDRKVYASWHKPLVVLCNQNSYSNAEIFAHAIKTLGRGKLVGVPTAGGVISATRDRILDAGTLRVPFRGWFLPDTGEDMEMNGAVPDYIVWPDPTDQIAGVDKQLEKAVGVLLEDVKTAVEKPFTPHYRNRHALPK
ncbi:tricorn protease [Haloferula luteola]|uniref:Tricorn protease homolog n=1 Tax=Haloferula luteola TaxID=595692 RepID=A0A840UWT4_9BACT|nr:S41 family peptidase [Haloferula luteola]MBB5350617.1 tricorn protease [Haloferula luteola]